MDALADGEYDAIVMGTGLKECVISGLLRYVVFCSFYYASIATLSSVAFGIGHC